MYEAPSFFGTPPDAQPPTQGRTMVVSAFMSTGRTHAREGNQSDHIFCPRDLVLRLGETKIVTLWPTMLQNQVWASAMGQQRSWEWAERRQMLARKQRRENRWLCVEGPCTPSLPRLDFPPLSKRATWFCLKNPTRSWEGAWSSFRPDDPQSTWFVSEPVGFDHRCRLMMGMELCPCRRGARTAKQACASPSLWIYSQHWSRPELLIETKQNHKHQKNAPWHEWVAQRGWVKLSGGFHKRVKLQFYNFALLSLGGKLWFICLFGYLKR